MSKFLQEMKRQIGDDKVRQGARLGMQGTSLNGGLISWIKQAYG